ncbi:(2Fe-2S)-binding protein [Undibacterium sp. Ren11W]|uniref:(2Fe-2S)-binding protein n=1 Tax=Undibacterium sp. Ren11W TaxID=3413045 RepID=UPI003BEFFC06
MTDTISIRIDGQILQVASGISVAAAIALAGHTFSRISVSGQPRAAVCGMGICQECRVSINGRAQQLACQTLCQENMQIQLAKPAAASEVLT